MNRTGEALVNWKVYFTLTLTCLSVFGCNSAAKNQIPPEPPPPTLPKFVYFSSAYETTGLDEVVYCEVNQTTGFFSNCQNFGFPNFQYSTSLLVKSFDSLPFLFVNSGMLNLIYKCQTNPFTGALLTTCTSAFAPIASSNDFTFFSAKNGNTYLYALESTDNHLPTQAYPQVLKCLFDAQGNSTGPCQAPGDSVLTVPNSGYSPNVIEFFELNNQPFVFIIYNAGQTAEILQSCLVDDTGNFNNCIMQTPYALGSVQVQGIQHITFATLNNRSYAYFVAGSTQFGAPQGLYQCNMNNQGIWSDCASVPEFANSDVADISVQTINGSTFMYVMTADTNGYVQQCVLDSNDGSLTNCATAYSPLYYQYYIAFSP